MQLCGDDTYTKSLMQKVASGQATDEETAAFNKHVNQARSLPSIQNLLQRPEEASSSVSPGLSSDTWRFLQSAESKEIADKMMARTEQGDASARFCPGLPARHKLPQNNEAGADGGPLLLGLPKDLGDRIKQAEALLKQEHRAGKSQETEMKRKEFYNMDPPAPGVPARIKLPENFNPREHEYNSLPDYEQQLRMLEAHNKKRLVQARATDPAYNEHVQRFEEQCRQKRFDMHLLDGAIPLSADKSAVLEEALRLAVEKEQRDTQHGPSESSFESDPVPGYDKHGRPLANVDEWLQHRDECRTDAEKRRTRKAKGLAATHAANEEALRFKQATRENAAKYTKPFCEFLTENPTVFHAVDAMKQQLKQKGWTELSERESWDIKPEGYYFIERNGSSLIAFAVGAKYKPGNGSAILAGHVDALTAKVKPISQVPNKAGYLQLGVAPYAGALNSTWWDRDLSIGGRVHVRDGDKIVTKLVKLDWPIARIPSLAPHFGAAAAGPFDKETQMVPIIGLDSSDSRTFGTYGDEDGYSQPPLIGSMGGKVGHFVETQPPALVKVIGEALGLNASSYTDIVNWELELFDLQPATVGGLNKEFIFAGRIDDKLCSWAALQALIESQKNDTAHSSIIKVVGLFDDEEIGSLLRQGAKGNFLPSTMERAVGSLAGHYPNSDLMGRTYANSFMVSSDVTHAANPNFLGAYLENHAPHLNVGLAIAADSNGHMTTDSVSTTILKRCADKVGAKLQVFQIRNGTPSGGTVGPMLSSAIGVRSIDAGLAQLSMHSIRATTGALDPGLGVIMFAGFLNGFEGVDKEFQG